MEMQSIVTSEIRIGDLIVEHAGIFQVNSIRGYYDQDNRGKYGLVIACETQFIRDFWEHRACTVPEHWRKPSWTVQGNDLARWTRLVG